MKGGGGRQKPTKKITTSDLPKQKQKSVQSEQENEYDDDDEQEQVPELAEGYYVIEAVRKKRVHKGATQYLIKWQGWPESANTWEPVENLSVCPELIEAFEERKNRSKGKRKHRHSGATMSRSKKEKQQMQQQVPEVTYKQKQQVQEQFPEDTYPVPAVQLTILEEPCLGRCVHLPNMTNVAENTVGTTYIGNANPLNNTVSVTGSLENGEKEEVSKSDVEVIDPKATSSKDEESMAEFGIHIQEDVAAENAISNVDTTDVLRVSPRLGTRRRKSCSVKRFKKDPNSLPKKDAAGKTTAASDVVVQDNINNGGDMNGLDSKNVIEFPQSVSVITKIVKPVNYSTSILNGAEEVCVSFLVRRSDGEEVVVDNKYLKENNPVLLINFYEQHLRYNNPSE